MIIDFHTHAFPEKVAARAIERLETMYDVKAFSDGSVNGLLSHMAASGVDLSVVLAVSTSASQVVSINTWIANLPQISADAGKRSLIGFGSIHPEFEGYRDEIQRMKELGIKGVKFQPDFQEFYPDDERMFPVYEELMKAGLIILFHIGDEIKPADIIYSTPQRISRLLDAMKNEINNYNYRLQTRDNTPGPAKIIAAHLGGHRMWDESEEHLLGRDIYFDASYVFGQMDFARATRIIRSHGIEKILFASDFPFARQEKDVQAVMQLDIDQKDKEKIFGGNASLLLGLD